MAHLPPIQVSELNLETMHPASNNRRASEVDKILRSLIFDPAHYLAYNDDVSSAISSFKDNPFEHFVEYGHKEWRTIHPIIDISLLRADVEQMDSGVTGLLDYVTQPRLWRARPNLLFDPTYYIERLGVEPEINPLLHYLRFGWKEKLSPHPLFSPRYIENWTSRISSQRELSPLEIFVRVAPPWLSPHPLFSAIFYLRHYGAHEEHSIFHYLRHGIHFDAAPSPLIDPVHLRSIYPTLTPAERIFALADEWRAVVQRPVLAGFREQDVGERDFKDRRLKALISKPLHACEICFILPFFRRGGGELATSYYVKIAAEIFSARRVLVILADYDDIVARGWLPEGVEVLTIGENGFTLEFESRCDLLRGVVEYLRPRRIHVVNSDVGWTVVSQCGALWSKSMRIYGSFFAFQYSDNGEPIGFIAKYFRNCFEHLEAVFHDNERVRTDLVRVLGLDEKITERLHVALNPLSVPTAAVSTSREAKQHVDVLWAGRLDEEKLPDILAEVAAKLPTRTFHVWGARTVDVRDAAHELRQLTNVCLMGPYPTFGHIVGEFSYSCFVFTSKWEGMPNVLLEAVDAGLPVIAAAVGGIPELIQDKVTGYLVEPARNVPGYVAAIENALSNIDEARARAERARLRLRERHTWDNFAKIVSKVYRSDNPHNEENFDDFSEQVCHVS